MDKDKGLYLMVTMVAAHHNRYIKS